MRILFPLLLLLLVPAVEAQQLFIGEASGIKGETAEIEINLRDAPGIGGLDILLSYDAEVLKLNEVKAGSLTGASMLRYAEREPGRVKIAIVDSNGLRGNGSVAVLFFDVLGDPGNKSEISFVGVKSYDAETVAPIILDTSGAEFTVAEKQAAKPEAGEKKGVCGPIALLLLSLLPLLAFKRR